MTFAKINIECGDKLLAAAIASTIGRALEAEKFTNVRVKCLMAYQEVAPAASGAVSANFNKKSTICELLDDPIQHRRPPMYVAEIIPVLYIDTVPPSMLACAIERDDKVLSTPILIDMGMEPAPYEKLEKAFLSGDGE